jgi:hypothetical protein
MWSESYHFTEETSRFIRSTGMAVQGGDYELCGPCMRQRTWRSFEFGEIVSTNSVPGSGPGRSLAG